MMVKIRYENNHAFIKKEVILPLLKNKIIERLWIKKEDLNFIEVENLKKKGVKVLDFLDEYVLFVWKFFI